MSILVTGGTGKTGTALAQRLYAANIPFVLASRTGKAPAPYKAAVFDWFDAVTYENPFTVDPAIDRVYLVVPQLSHETVHVKAFIDFAHAKGIKRFVLLSATQFEPGQGPIGKIHQYIVDSGVDYAVLRPTWFQENFGQSYLTSIRDEDQIVSATEDGPMAFVSTDDIAVAAVEALTAETSLNKGVFVFGPELFTHTEAAALFSTVLGREIKNVRVTVAELTKLYLSFGLRGEHAEILASLEGATAKKLEENLWNSDASTKWIGKRKLEDYIRENRELWIKE